MSDSGVTPVWATLNRVKLASTAWIDRSPIAGIRRLRPAHRRALAAVLVVGLHLLLVYVLIIGLKQRFVQHTAPTMELTLDPGGPRVARGAPTKPALVVPNEPEITPPEIAIDTPASSDAILATAAVGGPGVTVPAEAIGTSHTVPTLSSELLALAHRAMLRLQLTIAADGTVIDAMVENSSGSAALDNLVLAWVKAHWRYRPAMRNGTAISVTTTSLVPF
jgi:TonB family protein